MIAKRLKKVRESKGLTKSELERRSGISKRTIENIEYGKASPTLNTVEKLSKALEVDIVDLIK